MTIKKDEIAMLRFLLDSNIMDGEDIAKYTMKEEKLKEQKVLEVHKNKITKSVRIKNGKPYEFYQTCYGEGSKERMKCSTYKAIIGKLYEVYFGRVHRIPTLNEAFNEMIETRRRNESVEELTLTHYKDEWERYILGRKLSKKEKSEGKFQYERFKKVDSPINEIKKSDITELYEYLVGDERITLKTFNNIKTVVNAAFNYAGNLDDVECIDASRIDTKNIARRCRVVDNSDQVFDENERNLLLDYLEGLACQTVYTLCIRLLFCLAIRVGEARAITWEDVDFDRKILHIRHQIVTKPKDGKNRVCVDVDHMKSRSKAGKRDYPLSDYAIDVLRQLQEINGDKKYVLNSAGDNPVETNKINEHLKGYCKAVGIMPRSSHKIRFAACTEMYRNGVDEKVIQTLMGHSSVTTTRGYDRRKKDTNLPDDILQTVFGRKMRVP